MGVVRLVILLALIQATTAHAGVIINEIFYNAPDDLEDVQWVELHNTDTQPVDLGGWTLDGSERFAFPQGAAIQGQGYLVVALNPEQFRRHYNMDALGPFKKPLKRGGERITLFNAKGERADVAQYKDSPPWPLSADGGSSSLERICPSAPGELAENWTASPLPAGAARPCGTPGKQNASFAASLPPAIKIVSDTPDTLAPNQSLRVEAEVKDTTAPRQVSLLYRVVTAGEEGKETAIPMTRDAATGRFAATLPPQNANTLVRYRVQAVNEAGARRFIPAEYDLRSTFSVYVHEPWEAAKIPFAFILHVRPNPSTVPPAATQPARRRSGGGLAALFGFGGSSSQAEMPEERPARGTSAFIYVDPKAGKTMLFDHVNIMPRTGRFGPNNTGRGYKVFFHKDRPLNGMSAVSILFEGSERFLLNEALAYDLYRRVGNAASLTEFVRLWVDGRMIGYHLLVERPNKSFLRRNKVNPDGNLYKLLWYGRGIVGQHEKKTHTHAGHDDLLTLVQQLQSTSGDEQWQIIEKNFNVDQVATYFAVNMILSHWDGYFNNYFTYHDAAGTGKWEMYPWDQDKTWGYYDGLFPGQVFFDMPLTFGMNGDRPPAGAGGFFGGTWWRPAGFFSGPLLANPRFRQIFLARTKYILENVYTQEVYFPLIDAMAERLKDDVALRAKMFGNDAAFGERSLAQNVESLRTHLLKRRQFLLEQEELRLVDKNTAPAAGAGVGGRKQE